MPSTALILLSKAATAIAKCRTVGDYKTCTDTAASMRVFARKQQWSVEQRAEISEIEIRATIGMGELLMETPKQFGARGKGKKVESPTVTPLSELGITKNQSSRAQQVASVPSREREKYIAENKPKDKLSVTGLARIAKEKKREAKRASDRQAVQSSTTPATLEAVFSTIVIDPPWDFGDEGDVDQFGRGKPDYATMTIEEITALPVGERTAKDSHLYLWITNRSLPKGFGLLDAWGFRYVTCLTWCKPSIGMGNYFRGSTEQILFGVRGSLPLKRNNAGTWFTAERPQKKHSSKPSEFYELVESCSHGPYLEMFSRSKREGWTHWGSTSAD